MVDKVVGIGDDLDGSTVVDARIWPEGLSNAGQIAFWACLADGHTGVYFADPLAQDITATGIAAESRSSIERPGDTRRRSR
jgi:hypothetical protein